MPLPPPPMGLQTEWFGIQGAH